LSQTEIQQETLQRHYIIKHSLDEKLRPRSSNGIKWHLISGDDITVSQYFQYHVSHKFQIDNNAKFTISNDAQLVVHDGEICNFGEIINNGEIIQT